jgi:hypothetical protein
MSTYYKAAVSPYTGNLFVFEEIAGSWILLSEPEKYVPQLALDIFKHYYKYHDHSRFENLIVEVDIDGNVWECNKEYRRVFKEPLKDVSQLKL